MSKFIFVLSSIQFVVLTTPLLTLTRILPSLYVSQQKVAVLAGSTGRLPAGIVAHVLALAGLLLGQFRVQHAWLVLDLRRRRLPQRDLVLHALALDHAQQFLTAARKISRKFAGANLRVSICSEIPL